jgi:hypothetical protein
VVLARSSLGKMAASSCRAPGLWVRGTGSLWGYFFTLVPKPFCSTAAASKPLDAQQLAEKLRAQKREQKSKKLPVSVKGPQLPEGSALTGFPGGGCVIGVGALGVRTRRPGGWGGGEVSRGTVLSCGLGLATARLSQT